MASLDNYGSLESLISQFKVGIGAWLIGTFLTAFLVGMLTQQAFQYFRLYHSDPLFMKAWVILAVVLQYMTIALMMHTGYYYLVTYSFNPAIFTKPDVWTSAIVPIFGSLNNLVCESFFARRVFMIGRRYRIIVLSAMVMIIASCGFFISVTAQAFMLRNLVKSAYTGGWLPVVGSALLLAGDLQLTGVLVFVLHQARSGNRRTDSMLDILIAYAITTVRSLQPVAKSGVFPHSTIYTATTLIAQAVYNNSFLVALNTRQMVRSRGELDETHLDTGIVLGEKKRPSAAKAANRPVNIPLAPMVFAQGTSESQFTATGQSASDAALATSTQSVKPQKPTMRDSAISCEPEDSLQKRSAAVLATV
ncbi:hypothetical protein FKP32DRAFT_1672575 [Trametes sanguinea]|nr:hypothetical protein FKP32DRAFT_1672575 [Trametes sanguinea]